MRVVHLPVYEENPYQLLLMNAENKLGIETIQGGAGGNFLRTALFRWKADILHFHWLHPYIIRPSALGTIFRATRFLIELCILKCVGQRIVWTVHNLTNHENRHVALERWFTKRFCHLASAIIAHSQRAAVQIASAFAISDLGGIHITPHGNYIGYYPNQVSSREARQKLGLPQEPTVFLFLGRIQPYKGVLELIREFKSLPLDSLLLIAGPTADAGLERTIRNEIGTVQNIIFHPGFVPPEKVQFYMNACDVVALPYREILTSGAAMLAMSFAKPCLAPRLSGMTDLLDEEGAFLYSPSQPQGLSQTMTTAAHKRDELLQMGCYNLAKISNQSWIKVAEAILPLYRNVC